MGTEGEHVHDQTVSSISIKLPGEVDLEEVQKWVGNILQTEGANIFRMKGVLAIAHSEMKFVYQAVHMIFNGDFDGQWEEGEEKMSNLVFIGKNLDHDKLRNGFTACAYSEEKQAAKLAALRFKVGQEVECNTANGWAAGKVVQLMFRGDYMDPGMVAPYQVQLTDGTLIYAPMDSDQL